jgi:hypothetical protein
LPAVYSSLGSDRLEGSWIIPTATTNHEKSRLTSTRPVSPLRPRPDRDISERDTQEELREYGVDFDRSDSNCTKDIESLNEAIIKVLAPDLRLVTAVITYCDKLPAHLRSFVNGVVGHGKTAANSATSSTPSNVGENTGPHGSSLTSRSLTKRTRKAQEEDGDQDEDKPRKTRLRDFKGAQLQRLKYACPFNVKYPGRYCIRNEMWGTGDLYKSCIGTGWTGLRHLK